MTLASLLSATVSVTEIYFSLFPNSMVVFTCLAAAVYKEMLQKGRLQCHSGSTLRCQCGSFHQIWSVLKVLTKVVLSAFQQRFFKKKKKTGCGKNSALSRKTTVVRSLGAKMEKV